MATVVAFDDAPFCFTALRNGNGQAITQVGPKLVGPLANVPDRANDEVSAFSISSEHIRGGIPLSEAAVRSPEKEPLRKWETGGKAAAIFDAWFRLKTEQPLPRPFRIGDHD